MSTRIGWVKFLLQLANVVAFQLLMRLIAFLLEVPSKAFSFRQGWKVFVGWILLALVSLLAVELILSRCRWWRTLMSPKASSSPRDV